jgi:LCP family protein required for cell wall assembly
MKPMVKRIAFLVLVLLILAGLAFVAQSWLGRDRVSVFSLGGDSDMSSNLAVLVLGQVGVGQGGQWHAAPGLADAVVLVYYCPESNVANLISLPRDLYIELDGEYLKLNRVITDGKIDALLRKLLLVVGIRVDKYLVLDLELVEGIVDGLGGIEVDLPAPVADPVGSFYLQAGHQELDGEEAVWLIRNRFAPEGDFFRERNQHLVIEAIFDKFKSLSPLGKTTFAFELLPLLAGSDANFSVGELAARFRNIDELQFNSVVLSFDTELLVSQRVDTVTGEAYVLIPKEGMGEYREIRHFVLNNLK